MADDKKNTSVGTFDPIAAALHRSQKGQVGSRASGNGMMKRLQDFFGNPQVQAHAKVQDPLMLRIIKGMATGSDARSPIAGQVRLVDQILGNAAIVGPGAPDLRAFLEDRMLKKLEDSPESVAVPLSKYYGGHEVVPKKDLLEKYMSLSMKNPLANLDDPRFDTQYSLYHSLLKEQAAPFANGTRKNVRGAMPIDDAINSLNLDPKQKMQFHPDLLTHDQRMSPEMKQQIQDAIASGKLKIKGGATGKGKALDEFVPPTMSKDELNARRLKRLLSFPGEYDASSARQTQIPGSKARNYAEESKKLIPAAKGLRYLRNAAIAAAPVYGAYKGYQHLTDDE